MLLYFRFVAWLRFASALWIQMKYFWLYSSYGNMTHIIRMLITFVSINYTYKITAYMHKLAKTWRWSCKSEPKLQIMFFAWSTIGIYISTSFRISYIVPFKQTENRSTTATATATASTSATATATATYSISLNIVPFVIYKKEFFRLISRLYYQAIWLAETVRVGRCSFKHKTI